MREIKFRAWDSFRYGKMWFFSQNEKGGIIVDDSLCEGKITIMQFTGLQDKNGKDIYEGDIVALTGWDKMKDGSFFKVQVVWNMQKAKFVVKNLKNDGTPTSIDTLTSDGEVTGNIHENPELL